VSGLLAYYAINRPGGLPEHRPGAKYEHGLLDYCAFVEATALSSIKGSFHRVGTRFYHVRRLITVYRIHALVAWVHRVHGDESPDGIKCGPYSGGGLNHL
jgi:hypothetical protein